MKNLKIKFVPYEIVKERKIKDILKDVKKDTIVLIDAKLNPKEETYLIKQTMKKVSSRFSGIELSSLDLEELEKEKHWAEKIYGKILELILGKKRGITIIGPAKIIKKIEKDPKNLLLFIS